MLNKARKVLLEIAPDFALGSVQLLSPVPNTSKIICVGLNYAKHAAEAGRPATEFPTIFQRYQQTMIAHGETLLAPRVSEQFDFEGELAVVIGKGGSHIDETDAMSHVAGYSVFNDASVRDWQFHTHQYGMGKNFERTGALGPWMLTADEVPDYRKFSLKTVLNGEVMQTGKLDELIFTIPYLISYVSKALPWLPGDVLATGTPSGIGFKRKPPIYMKPGDEIEIEISMIGTLRNGVSDK
jgi:2-keto-4-pentenoate hydratase/2-oxohepta-3-ene-1,7-dioic acid hydratase in catechol pathway